MSESRQVSRATARHEAKVKRATDAGRTYPEAKYRPELISGKTYAPNGARERARRAA